MMRSNRGISIGKVRRGMVGKRGDGGLINSWKDHDCEQGIAGIFTETGRISLLLRWKFILCFNESGLGERSIRIKVYSIRQRTVSCPVIQK